MERKNCFVGEREESLLKEEKKSTVYYSVNCKIATGQ